MAVRKRGRPKGELTRCNGKWSEAEFNSFITRQLRGGSRKWAPIHECKKAANVSRGLYLCAGCKQEVPPTLKEGMKRKKNIFVDHIEPIVDPAKGFEDWTTFINRLYCEGDNLQLLCGPCHTEKTLEERRVATERRKNEKQV